MGKRVGYVPREDENLVLGEGRILPDDPFYVPLGGGFYITLLDFLSMILLGHFSLDWSDFTRFNLIEYCFIVPLSTQERSIQVQK